ncbi:MAG: ribosome silencing factor [Oscillospiraceae bacterium]|nr:ribosome silencing factor [Oscillospiraceae bacterium]
MTSLDKAKKIAKILDSKKAEDIKLLHVYDQTIITEYFAIAGADSTTQMKALADETEYQMNLEGFKPYGIEGYGTDAWTILDFGDVIVHIFMRGARDFYKLEKLWADAHEVAWNEE